MRWLALALLGACTSSSPPTIERDFPTQIVVTAHSVQLYTGGADRDGPCAAVPFPAAGTCSTWSDASPCSGNVSATSCITDFGIEVDGARQMPTGYGGDDPRLLFYDALPPGAWSLVLAGCGHPATRISLDGVPFPQVSATADYSAGQPHVSWTTDDSPLGVLLMSYGGEFGEVCQETGTAYTFTDLSFALGIDVQALGSRADMVTAFGPTTIWRAGEASAMLPATP